MKHLACISFAAALLAAAALPAADFLAVAKAMTDDGEDIRTGEDAASGWYVVTVSKLAAGDAGDGGDPAAYALLAGKRRIAGYVSGEKVAAREDATTTEVSKDNAAEVTETFLQKIRVEVDAVMRGIEPVGEIKAKDGVRYLVLAATAKTVDASKAMQAAMQGLGPDTVRAVGIAMIADGDNASARKTALASAKSSAVEMVLGTAVASVQSALNMNATAKTISNAGGFIKQFRVEEDEAKDGVYRVVIVAEIERKKLVDDYSSFLAQFGDVKFHVGDCGDTMLNTMLEEQLAIWNCPLTQNRKDADYLVWHRWEFRDEVHPMDGRTGTRLTLTLGVCDAATGREFWSVNNDPRKAVSFVGDQNRRIRNAADLAMKEIHGKIHERLDRMIGRMTASGREVRMVFDNYSVSYDEPLNVIRNNIAAIPGCDEGSLETDAKMRTAVLTFRCQTDMETLKANVEKVIREKIKGAAFRPETVSTTANTWNLTW